MPNRSLFLKTGDPKMPKLKTKSGAKKRFSLTATGKVRMNPACRRHNLRRRPQRMKRQSRGPEVMSAPDAKIVKKFYLPYG